MKPLTLFAALAAALAAPMSRAGDVSVDIHIGNPPPPVVVAPAPGPVYVAPAYGTPDFVFAPTLGFYVAVGIPDDIVYVDNVYFVYRSGIWYRGPYYNGPWVVVEPRFLPPGLRRHRYEYIHRVRDEQYRAYREDNDRFRHFRPAQSWKEERKEDKREWKEERRQDKQDWKDDRGRGHGRGRD